MTSKLSSEETIHTWELFPLMIQWHQHHRKFIKSDLPGDPRHHINALLIMNSAIMIEGAICSLLLFYLNGSFSPLFFEKDKELLIKRVSEAGWDKYKALFLIITKKKLTDVVGINWEPISLLFDFRNLLSHGEQLQIKGLYSPQEGFKLNKLQRSKENLFKYLEKKKFIDKPKCFETIGWSFLSDEIADHFVDTARSFLSELAENVPDHENDETFPKRLKSILLLSMPTDESFNESFYSSNKET